jgi:hypothetical protein
MNIFILNCITFVVNKFYTYFIIIIFYILFIILFFIQFIT